MTLRELKSLKNLNRECTLEKRRLASIRASLEREGCATLFGIHPVISPEEKARLNGQITSLEESCTRHLEEILRKYDEITAFINAIPDAYGRMILSLRFISGLSWIQVAAHIGGGCTEDAVRKYCMRHLKKYGITE